MQITIDGRTAYAYTGGKPFDPGLPAVAFVHGAQNDHSVWVLQTRWLAHHGYSVQHTLADINRVLDVLDEVLGKLKKQLG